MSKTAENPCVGVDSGSIIIIDPCYVIRDKAEWADVVGQMGTQQPIPYKGGVILDNFGGDGHFPVEVERDPATGLILSATIRFMRASEE